MKHSCILKSMKIKYKPLEQWWEERRSWVFKPFTGDGSRGVYVGYFMT